MEKETKYKIEIYFDYWDNNAYSLTHNKPFINMSIGELFDTQTAPFEGMSDFEHKGRFKIIAKHNYIFDKHFQTVSYLLDSSVNRVDENCL